MALRIFSFLFKLFNLRLNVKRYNASKFQKNLKLLARNGRVNLEFLYRCDSQWPTTKTSKTRARYNKDTEGLVWNRLEPFATSPGQFLPNKVPFSRFRGRPVILEQTISSTSPFTSVRIQSPTSFRCELNLSRRATKKK